MGTPSELAHSNSLAAEHKPELRLRRKNAPKPMRSRKERLFCRDLARCAYSLCGLDVIRVDCQLI